MATIKDDVAAQSMNSRALGGFLFLAGLVITLGTYGFGIVLGGPLMLMGIAFPIWRNSRAKRAGWPQRATGDMTQDEAARSGGVVMSRGEAERVAHTAHRESRKTGVYHL